MDNTGNYVTYQELLERLFPSTYVSYKSKVTLSGKTGNDFTVANCSFTLEKGDLICQGIYAQEIAAVNGSVITLYDGTNIQDGIAHAYRSTEDVESLDALIKSAMQKIDLYCGQWFNKREFVGADAIKIEGSNSHILHFSVPIIDVTSMTINGNDFVQDVKDYRIHNSRTLPDDRRNPRIKLISDSSSIYDNTAGRTGRFMKQSLQIIEGSFGFLEQDGSTPQGIKWATARIIMQDLSDSPEESASGSLQVKKEKVDIHEIEYFQESTDDTSSSGNMTGDAELDRVIKMYKAPFAIGGTDPLLASVRPYYRGGC